MLSELTNHRHNAMHKHPPEIRPPLRRIPAALLLASTLSPFQAAISDEIRAGQFYEQAIQAQQNQNLPEAIIDLKNALQENPNYVAAHILLGEIYLKQQSLSEAEVQLTQAKQLGADQALLIKPLAQLYLYQLKYDQLIKEIDPSRFSRDLQPTLHLFRGDAYVQLGELSAALNEYDMASQINPGQIDSLIGRANTLLRRGDIDGARTATDKALQMKPDDPGVRFVIGSIKHSQGDLNGALTEYDATLAAQPEHLDARLARIGILMDQHRDDQALQDLDYVKEHYSFDPRGNYLRSVILARNNRIDESVKELNTAADTLVNLKPELVTAHAQTLMLSGLVNFGLQRYDIAVSHLQLYVRQFPEQIGGYKLLASALLAKNEPEQVITLLKPVLVRNPRDYRLMFLLGSAYMRTGRHDLASTMLEKASALSADGEQIHTEIGLNLLSMGQEQMAAEELEASFKNNPGNTQAGTHLVSIYISRGESANALRVAKAMVEQAPKNITLINLMGTAQVSAKQYKQARQSFERAIELEPNFVAAYVNLGRLDAAENKLDAAKSRLENLLNKQTDNVTLMTELALIELAAGNPERAESWLAKARKVDQKSIPVLLALIEVKLHTGKTTEAVSIAEAAELIDKNDHKVLDALARCYLANNSRDRALAIYIRMADQARLSAKLLYKVARRQLDAEDQYEAIKTLKKAVLADPKHLPSQIALVETELNYGKPVFALSRAENLRQQYPNRSFARTLLGDIAMHDKNYALAVTHFQEGFNLEPNSQVLMKLFDALKQTDRNSEAYGLLSNWLEKHPEDSVPLAALAEENMRAGRFAAAEKQYDKLLKKFPDEPQFLNNLAYVYFNLGNPKALVLAENAVKLAPEHPSANDTLGWILANTGNPEKGLRYLRDAHSRLSGDPEIRYHIAAALEMLKRNDEAKAELQEALNSGQSFNGIDKAKILLEKLNR